MSTLLSISVGQPVSAELPNITGGFVSKSAPNVSGSTTGTSTGAFADVEKARGQYYDSGVDNESVYNFSFDASFCSSIYKDSATTVVPESLITNFYIMY